MQQASLPVQSRRCGLERFRLRGRVLCFAAVSVESATHKNEEDGKGRKVTLGVLLEEFLAGLLATGGLGVRHYRIVRPSDVVSRYPRDRDWNCSECLKGGEEMERIYLNEENRLGTDYFDTDVKPSIDVIISYMQCLIQCKLLVYDWF